MNTVTFESIYVFMILCLSTGNSFTLDRPEWTWVAGELTGNEPSQATYPPGLYGAATWSNEYGDAWLFGGNATSVSGQGGNLTNDLWMYSSSYGTWERISISGDDQPQSRFLSSLCGIDGLKLVLFGGEVEQGITLQDTWVFDMYLRTWSEVNMPNKPPARSEATTWCTHANTMVIFGGLSSSLQVYADLWYLDMTTMTWTMLEEHALRHEEVIKDIVPSWRNGAMTWVGHRDKLYVAGGNSLMGMPRVRHIGAGYLIDMWSLVIDYTHNTFEWTLERGPTSMEKAGIYGTRDVTNADNRPGSRKQGLTWVDQNDNLWMFGGEGADADIPKVFAACKLLNDLWMYDTSAREWVWISGDNEGNGHARYTYKNSGSVDNIPSSRYMSASWQHGNVFYVFGGHGHDDHAASGHLNDMWTWEYTGSLPNFSGHGSGAAQSCQSVLLYIFSLLWFVV